MNTTDLPQPEPAEPERRTHPPGHPGPEIRPPIVPQPGVPSPEITNPVPGTAEPNPAGPQVVPPGVPFIE